MLRRRYFSAYSKMTGTSTGPLFGQSDRFLIQKQVTVLAKLSRSWQLTRLLNHFPNHYELTRKDLMVKNIKR